MENEEIQKEESKSEGEKIICHYCKKEIQLAPDNNCSQRYIQCPFCSNHFLNRYFQVMDGYLTE